MTVILLSLAGGFGALIRFVVDGLVRTQLGRALPWGTFIINVTGSLLLGVVTGLVLHQHASTTLTLIVGTGFCGGYTTFSTASFETVRLIEEKRYWSAFANSGGTLLITLLAAAAGLGMVS